MASITPTYVAGTERGVRAVGDSSPSSAGGAWSQPRRSAIPGGSGSRAIRAFSARYSTSRTSVDFPEPDTPVTQTRRPSGKSTVRSRRLWRRAPLTVRRGAVPGGRLGHAGRAPRPRSQRPGNHSSPIANARGGPPAAAPPAAGPAPRPRAGTGWNGEAPQPLGRAAGGEGCGFSDVAAGDAPRERFGAGPRSSAVGAGLRVGLLVFPEGPEAFAGGAGAELLGPGEGPRVGHRQAGAALWAGSPRRIQAIRHAPRGSDEAASADLQRALHRGAKTAGPARAGRHALDEGLAVVDLIPVEARRPRSAVQDAVDPHAAHAALRRSRDHLAVEALPLAHERREQHHLLAGEVLRDPPGEARCLGHLAGDAAFRAVHDAETREEQPQVVIHLRRRTGGGHRRPVRELLFPRDRRRQALHPVHLRPRPRTHGH